MSYVEKNPWILHFDGSGCSGCGMEVQACFSPKFDVEQYGVRKTDNPKHADVLLITGIVEEENRDYLVHLYENMAEPKAVVAVGACACSGGIFEGCGDVLCGADQVLPVDLYVPGCAARPEIIIDGILKCFEKPETLEEPVAVEEPAKIPISGRNGIEDPIMISRTSILPQYIEKPAAINRTIGQYAIILINS